MKKQLLITFLIIFFGFTTYAQPGTIDLTFNPTDVGYGNGDGPKDLYYGNAVEVYSTVIQNDGKILIVGFFYFYNGQARNGIARLNVDGSIDTSFNPIFNNMVGAISIQNDGKIIIGGNFTSCNGITRNRIARINIDGSLDTSFNPGTGIPLNSSIGSIAIQSDGKIVIGGDFLSYNGIARKNIARINTNGSLDTSFNPGIGPDGMVSTTAIQSDGKIIIGGVFNNFNNIAKIGLVRLNSNGSLDASFNAGSGLNSAVKTISIQSDGGIIIGGDFTTIDGRNRPCIARFNANGTFDPFFAPFIGGKSGNFICIQADGNILLSATDSSYNSYLYRISSQGIIDNSFNPSFLSPTDSRINSISIQNDSKLILGASGGTFVGADINNSNPLIRINSDGSKDTNFNKGTGANYPIYTTAIQNDGKIFIGGDFLKFNGTVRNKIARLNPNGSLEITANPITIGELGISTSIIQNDGKILISGVNRKLIRLNYSDLSYETQFHYSPTFIKAISIQNDGNIIVGGDFSNSTLFPRTFLGRIFSSDAFDNSFGNGFGGNSANGVKSISARPDGKIIISGSFGFFGSTYVGYITKLNSNGSLGSFSVSNCNGPVECHKVQNDEKIIIGGSFTLCQGETRNGIARMNAFGSLDTSFNPGTGVNGLIRSISIQSDGKIIIGGDFTTYNGTPSNHIARLNIDGTLDNSFIIGTGTNGIVRTTAIQSDGKIIIAGDFTAYNGVGRNRIARINGNNTLTNSSFDKSSIAIYPNPSKGIYTLQTNEMNTAKSISIYTILGQKIYDAVISSNETTIDISNQPKGVYLYKVFGVEGETKSGKLVIE